MTMSPPLQQTLWTETELSSTQSSGASPVRMFHSLASGLALKVRDLVSGVSSGASLASYDHESSSWKTCQGCLVSGSEPFLGTWPRSGMMLSGTVYRLQPSAPLTGGTGSGLLPMPEASNTKAVAMKSGGRPSKSYLIPTPRMEGFDAGGVDPRRSLNSFVRQWPTPTTRDWKDGSAQACQNVPANGLLGRVVHQFATPQSRGFRTGQTKRWDNPDRSRNLNDQIGGSLNADWVEWLMGFPIGWTVVNGWKNPTASRASSKAKKAERTD